MKRNFLLLILLTGCQGDFLSYQQVCPNPTTKEHQQWILDCIEKGNPKSDEEGEDLVAQCEKSGKNLFCPKEYGIWNKNNLEFVPCSVKHHNLCFRKESKDTKIEDNQIQGNLEFVDRNLQRTEFVTDRANEEPAVGNVRGWVFLGVCSGEKWIKYRYTGLPECDTSLDWQSPTIYPVGWNVGLRDKPNGIHTLGGIEYNTELRLLAYERMGGLNDNLQVWWGEVELDKDILIPVNKLRKAR